MQYSVLLYSFGVSGWFTTTLYKQPCQGLYTPFHVPEHSAHQKFVQKMFLCVRSNQMQARLLKTFLGAIHLLRGAAKLEADGAEAFKACCRLDWWLLARVAKQSTDAGWCCDRVGWNSHHSRTFTVLKIPICLFTAANFVPHYLFLLEINQWQQVPQCVRMFSDFRRWQQMLLILGERCHLCKKKKKKKNLQHCGRCHVDWRTGVSSDDCWRN